MKRVILSKQRACWGVAIVSLFVGIILILYVGAMASPLFLPRIQPCLSKSYCTDGMAPGYWIGPSWVTPSCKYRGFEGASNCMEPEPWKSQLLQQCLENKWIHFFGDSTSRHLYLGFLDILPNCTSSTNISFFTNKSQVYDEMTTCRSTVIPNFTVSYLFRGKVMHQRNPRAGFKEEDDLHNSFLELYSPDYNVMSVGPHEAIGWTRRPDPSRNFTDLEGDVDEFLNFLYKKVKYRGNLIWWKAHFFSPGKAVQKTENDSRYERVRVFYDDAQNLLMKKIRAIASNMPLARAIRFADFYQTTMFSQTVDGIHYPRMNKFHANIILNTICN